MRGRAAVIALLLTLAAVGVLSSRQAVAESHPEMFPSQNDLHLAYPPWWLVANSTWHDYAERNCSIEITEINRIVIDLKLLENAADPNNPLVFTVSLNSYPVGEFNVYGPDTKLEITTLSLGEFPWEEPIDTHGWVIIRYELVQCPPFTGIKINTDESTVTLSDGPPKKKEDFANDALDELIALRDRVNDSKIDQGTKRSLLSKLDRAIAKVEQALVYIGKGSEQKADNKLRIAQNSLLSFIKAVDVFSGKILPRDSLDWQSKATHIIELIEKAIRA